MGESRTELLAWLNNLLQLNYNKVEECGTGAAYCQVIDSIYGNVPMARVKMNARHDYEYLSNYKVLQNVFLVHKVNKPIPVERLVKCKMQDNLEFLQWIKRFWDTNYGGGGYDPVARRGGVSVQPSATHNALSSSSRPAGGLHAGGARTAGRAPSSSSRASSTQPNEAALKLQAQLGETQAQAEALEKEREFYFMKLRDIETIVQQQLETLQADNMDDPVLREVQKILYAKEEGFEVPSDTVDDDEMF